MIYSKIRRMLIAIMHMPKDILSKSALAASLGFIFALTAEPFITPAIKHVISPHCAAPGNNAKSAQDTTPESLP